MNVCHICNKTFSSSWNLTRHDNKFHGLDKHLKGKSTPYFGRQSGSGIDNADSSSAEDSPHFREYDFRSQLQQDGMGFNSPKMVRHQNVTSAASSEKASEGEGYEEEEESASDGSADENTNSDDENKSMSNHSQDSQDSNHSSPTEDLATDDVNSEDSEMGENSGDDSALEEETVKPDGCRPYYYEQTGDVRLGEFKDSMLWKPIKESFRLGWSFWDYRNLLVYHSAWLSKICKANREERIILLQKATSAEIDCISEIANNLLAGSVPLTERNYDNFRRFAPTLRLLVSRSTSHSKKKRLLIHASSKFLTLLVKHATPEIISTFLQ